MFIALYQIQCLDFTIEVFECEFIHNHTSGLIPYVSFYANLPMLYLKKNNFKFQCNSKKTGYLEHQKTIYLILVILDGP